MVFIELNFRSVNARIHWVPGGCWNLARLLLTIYIVKPPILLGLGSIAMAAEIKNLLFERMLSFNVKVPFDVLLVDLWYLDDRMDDWPRRDRQYALAGGLLRRNFMDNAVAAVEFADLWIRARELCGIELIEDVLTLCQRLYDYARSENKPLPGENAFG